MLQELVNDYVKYFKLDLTGDFKSVQDVIDNMITRLEELSSVLQMIKLKNSDCSRAVYEDINRYRSEVTILSKKIITLTDVVSKLQMNVDVIEKHIEKAESDFGVQYDNKLKSFLKPFLKKKDVNMETKSTVQDKIILTSVLDNFVENND